MNLFEGLETIPAPLARSTVAIGTFDGVHRGHQAIVRTAVEDARAQGRPALVFTFDRHPQELLAPDRAPAYLTTPAQRNRLIAGLGVDGLVVARFDIALSELRPETFVRTILKDRLGAEAIVVGVNFYFGRGREGDVAYLEANQEEFGYQLYGLAPVTVGGAPASSTRIRECLRAGEVSEAEEVLGHPYQLVGTVITGRKLGRTLGYPTANLQPIMRQVIPGDGIYAVHGTLANGQVYGGACSIGDRPTIEGAGRSIETYLFDFAGDLYGQEINLRFLKRLRAEKKFDTLDALKAQMARDCEDAKRIVAAAREMSVDCWFPVGGEQHDAAMESL